MVSIFPIDSNAQPGLSLFWLSGIKSVNSLEVLEFNFNGPVLAVRPYCHTDRYWQVYFDTNKIIRETFGAAGYPVPEQHFVVRNPS